MIKRDKRNIGKKVRYLPGHTMVGRATVVTGFRGDCGKFKRDPYVTTTDGNTTAGHLLEKVKGRTYIMQIEGTNEKEALGSELITCSSKKQ